MFGVNSHAQSVLSNKISEMELGRNLIKCLVGWASASPPRESSQQVREKKMYAKGDGKSFFLGMLTEKPDQHTPHGNLDAPHRPNIV